VIRHADAPLPLRCRPGLSEAEDREPVTTAVATLAVARHRRAGGCCRRTPTRPGGYWIPAFAGMTAVEVAMRSHHTSAEGANGSRLCAARGRDDVPKEGHGLALIHRGHPGQGAAATRRPLAARAVARARKTSPCVLPDGAPAPSRDRRAGSPLAHATERARKRRGSPVPDLRPSASSGKTLKGG